MVGGCAGGHQHDAGAAPHLGARPGRRRRPDGSIHGPAGSPEQRAESQNSARRGSTAQALASRARVTASLFAALDARSVRSFARCSAPSWSACRQHATFISNSTPTARTRRRSSNGLRDPGIHVEYIPKGASSPSSESPLASRSLGSPAAPASRLYRRAGSGGKTLGIVTFSEPGTPRRRFSRPPHPAHTEHDLANGRGRGFEASARCSTLRGPGRPRGRAGGTTQVVQNYDSPNLSPT